MQKIYLGTMICLLYQARLRKSDQLSDVCRRIFAAFNCSIDSYAKEFPSHLKSNHDPAPRELVDNVSDLDAEVVNQAVKQHVLDSIDAEKGELS